ncbi:MAG: hypothetical protein FJ265_07555 [Planctomycetes bacterium]|nr:hypothetical protein [Planctomycetota bacterium]
MNVREMTLVFCFGLPVIALIVGLLVARSGRGHALRMKRLQVLQEALRHPQLDDATRRELLAVLGQEHRRGSAGRLARFGYAAFLGVSWLMFVAGGAGWIYSEFVDLRWRDAEPFIVLTIAGFALLTLPVAVRELLGRGRTPSPASR